MIMKRYLYIFPHPDDESFGPAGAIYSQLKNGDEVFLLTLTKGGATKQRFTLGLSVEEMGEVRYKEMLDLKETLQLTGMDVLDFPDGGLKEMDPRILEKTISDYIKRIDPDILVSYPVHGISGFHDHLVMHAIIKRVYFELKEDNKANLRLKRLAFFTLPDSGLPVFGGDNIRLKQSTEEEIDCILTLSSEEIEAIKRALDCYKTYQQTIAESKVIEKIGNKLYFELLNEDYNPPLTRLDEGL